MMPRSLVLRGLITVGSVGISFQTIGQDCLGLVGRWPYGPPDAIAVTDDHAYYSSGAVFVVADVSDPLTPGVVGEVQLPTGFEDLVVEDGYAYAIDYDATLHIIDVSVPHRPNRVGEFHASDSRGMGIAVSEGYAFLAVGRGGLVVVDVSDPEYPTQVGWIDDYFMSDVAVEGSHAYGVGMPNIRILDVSDPAAPHQLAAITNGGYNCQDITVSDGFVYVVGCGWISDDLAVIDVRIPASPEVVAVYEDEQHGYGAIHIEGHYLYLAGTELTVLEITDPTDPVLIGMEGETEYLHLEDIDVSDGFAFSSGRKGIPIADVTDPADPTIVSWINTAGPSTQVRLAGDLLLARREGLHVLDLTDPTAPVEIGRYDDEYLDVFANSGRYAYIVGSQWDGVSGLVVVDLSDPSNPTAANTMAGDIGGSLKIEARGDFVYLAGPGNDAFEIVDVSDPMAAEIIITGSVPIENPSDFVVVGDYAFVSHLSDEYIGGLYVIDISDPHTPTEVAYLHPLSFTASMAVRNSYLYLVQTPDYEIIDVSSPTQPYVVDTIELGIVSRGTILGSMGDLLLVYGINDSLVRSIAAIDVSDRGDPTAVGMWSPREHWWYEGAAFHGPYAYLPAGALGVEVLDISGCPGFVWPLPAPRRVSGRRLLPWP
jgi:hypothetical protein